MRRPSPRALDRLIAALLALFAVGWLLAVEGGQGIGRDEAQYMRAGERYWGWFEELADNLVHGHPGRSFTGPGIDRYWFDNAPDHPVVMKVLYGMSWRAFHRCHCTGPTRGLHPIPVRGRHITLPLFARESTAFRFPAILMSGLLVAMVFGFARRWLPRAPAVAAAVLTLAQPHLFFARIFKRMQMRRFRLNIASNQRSVAPISLAALSNRLRIRVHPTGVDHVHRMTRVDERSRQAQMI